MTNQPADWLIETLDTHAAAMPYPPTPDIAGRIRASLQPKPPLMRLRALAGTALLIMLVLGALFAVPQTRAEVLRFIDVGVIRVLFGDEVPIVEPLALPDLPGETTLADARQSVSFDITLPRYPRTLGNPDHVYAVETATDPVIVLAWVEPRGVETPLLSLYAFGPNAPAWKYGLQDGTETDVNGDFAIWTDVPHLLEFETIDGLQSRDVTVPVLIWFDEPRSYRLEGAPDLATARRIAESLR